VTDAFSRAVLLLEDGSRSTGASQDHYFDENGSKQLEPAILWTEQLEVDILNYSISLL
jgi:hypothetical protein